MIKEWLERRIAHCEKRIAQYPEKLQMEKDSCHGGWGKGYWEGKLEAYQDMLDLISEKQVNV